MFYGMKKPIIFVLILVLLLGGCSAGPNTDTQPAEEEKEYVTPLPEEVTVTDSDGRTVTTSAENGDIVSVGYESTSLLIALGAKGRITGIDARSADSRLVIDSCPELQDTAVVTDDSSGLMIESITAQKPGLVILTDNYVQHLDALENAGLTVAVVRFDGVEQIKSSVELIGSLSNTRQAAQNLCSYYDSTLTRFKVLTMTEPQKTVTVYNNDEVLTELLTYINCGITDDSGLIIAKASDNVQGALCAPSLIEPWDEPSVSLVLGLYWYAYNIYPDIFSKEEITQQAIDFYAKFYGVKYTAQQLGLES